MIVIRVLDLEDEKRGVFGFSVAPYYDHKLKGWITRDLKITDNKRIKKLIDLQTRQFIKRPVK